MHTNTVLLFRKYAVPTLKAGMRVLEIGPDRFPSTLQDEAGAISFATWDTLDIYESPRLTYSNSKPYDYEIEANSYDCVISAQVLAHVRMPWRWMPEVARVLKPGGLVITVAAVSWTHMTALPDYWRVYPEGLEALYEDAGLTTELATWASLETAGYRKFSPGVSLDHQGRNKRLLHKALGPIGFPVERAYDTIAIARKPAVAAA